MLFLNMVCLTVASPESKAKGAKPGATDSGGWNILHHGARNQNATAIKFGLESHVSIHDRVSRESAVSMSVREGVATDSLKFHPGPLCPTFLCPAAGPPQKWPYSLVFYPLI
jgi:hypothetical protein